MVEDSAPRGASVSHNLSTAASAELDSENPTAAWGALTVVVNGVGLLNIWTASFFAIGFTTVLPTGTGTDAVPVQMCS